MLSLFHILMASVRPTAMDVPSLTSTLMLWIAWAALIYTSRAAAQKSTQLTILATAIVIISTMQSIWGIVSLISPPENPPFMRFQGLRANGTFSGSNAFGGLIAIGLPLTIILTLQTFRRAYAHAMRRRKGLLHSAQLKDYRLVIAAALVIATIVQLVALLLSGSRGAISGAVVATILLLLTLIFNRDPKERNSKTSLGISIIILVSLILLGTGGTYAYTFARLQAMDQLTEVALPRTTIWQATIPMLRAYPLGMGPGAFAKRFTAWQPEGFGRSRVYHAHNDYLEMAAEMGLPGILLLLTTLAIFMVVTTRHLWRPHAGNSVWIRRAALLGVMAGLIHATVDFNLSSRPGVASLFFCLIGIALSSPDRSQNNHRTPKLWHGKSILTIILLAILIANQWRLTAAHLYSERAHATLSGSTSLYLWLPPYTITPSEAVDKLRFAARIAPDSAQTQFLVASGLNHRFDTMQQRMIRDLRRDTPSLSEDQAQAAAALIQRLEEQEMLNEAANYCHKAVTRAPLAPEYRAFHAYLLARKALIAPPQERKQLTESAVANLQIAVKRAPRDIAINSTLLTAVDFISRQPLPAEATAESRAAIIAYIKQAAPLFSTSGGDTLLMFMSTAERLQMDTTEFANHPDIAIDALWNIVRHYERTDRRPLALHAIDRLELRLAEAPQKNLRLSTGKWMTNDDIHTYQQRMIQKRADLLLQTHQFEAYRDLAPQHAEAFQQRISRQLVPRSTNPFTAARFRFLDMQRIWEIHGLDPDTRQQYMQLLNQNGGTASAIANVAMQTELFPTTSETQLSYPDYYQQSVFTRHRYDYLNARSHVQSGNFAQAKTLILQAHDYEGKDPDILRFMQQYAEQLGFDSNLVSSIDQALNELQPEHQLDVPFYGERIILQGMTLTNGILKTYWQFRTQVPSDLSFTIRFITRDNQTEARLTRSFSAIFSHEFGVGMPPIGRTFVLDMPIPPRAAFSRDAIMWLRTSKAPGTIDTMSGLRFLRINDWASLATAPPDKPAEPM